MSSHGPQVRESLVREVERNPDQRRSVGAPPLIAQVHRWVELGDPLVAEFLVHLFDERLHRRPGQFQPELTDGRGENLLEFFRK